MNDLTLADARAERDALADRTDVLDKVLPEGELVELAESIRANGLRNPIVITPEGLVLDGRNRLAACELVDVEPATVDQYADLAGVNRITMYSHVKTGEVPTLRIGRRIRVPSAFVLRQLRIEAAA